MTAHNRHLLAEGAYRVNRDAAARAEREAVVAFLRRQGDQLALEAPSAAELLRALAVCIEAGDHLR